MAAEKSLALAGGIPVYCSHTAIEPLEKFIPNPRNPNRHPEAQIELLSKIISVQGWRAPITVSNQSGFVVKGHGRLMAAQKLQLSHAPVDYQDYPTPALEYADMIADNRLAELAEMDMPALKDLLLEVDTGELDMELTGFNQEALADLMTETHQGPGNGTTGGGLGTPILQYNIVFEHEQQQDKWFAFIKHLNAQYSDLETIAARLEAYISTLEL